MQSDLATRENAFNVYRLLAKKRHSWAAVDGLKIEANAENLQVQLS